VGLLGPFTTPQPKLIGPLTPSFLRILQKSEEDVCCLSLILIATHFFSLFLGPLSFLGWVVSFVFLVAFFPASMFAGNDLPIIHY